MVLSFPTVQYVYVVGSDEIVSSIEETMKLVWICLLLVQAFLSTSFGRFCSLVQNFLNSIPAFSFSLLSLHLSYLSIIIHYKINVPNVLIVLCSLARDPHKIGVGYYTVTMWKKVERTSRPPPGPSEY